MDIFNCNRSSATWQPSADPFGHIALNDSFQNHRIHTHDAVVNWFRQALVNLGFSVSYKEADVPSIGPAASVRHRADLLLRSSGISRCPLLTSQARTVFDVSLVHSANYNNHQYQFSTDKVLRTESLKKNRYQQGYRAINIAFAPIVVDSFGRIGHSTLRVLQR